jgi:hydroxyethylthiazole kinase-like uncharacterized protein yjeF
MNGLYSTDAVRAFDAAAIDSGIPGYELMTRAAAAALRELRARWPVARDLLVLCGAGNNGGDGYVLARLAKSAGLSPRVVALVGRERLKDDAARAADDCLAAGVPVLAHQPQELASRLGRSDLVVDALLGIGLNTNVREELARVIGAINESGRPVLAIDIPSGLCADTGAVRGVAVIADLTATFIARKLGLWLHEGPRHAGTICFDSLSGSEKLSARSPRSPRARLLDSALLGAALPRRPLDAHKGSAGHVLVIGGGEGMPGAARLAGLAALRAGAGRVTVLAAPSLVSAVAAGCAELMVRSIDPDAMLDELLAAADALALGPGLGRTPWGRAVFSRVCAALARHELPVVLDADALNLLAESRATPAHCVLTPHPGEAARLLGISSAAVQQDRLAALRALEAAYPATIVLKGAGTLVSDRVPWLCPYGNPAMAAPGMGDVLTGIIAALLGQRISDQRISDQRTNVPLAARVGVLWHALAGDVIASADGRVRHDRGLLASELAEALPAVLRSSSACLS